MLDFTDTIVAPATSTGGALALIRVSGPDALRILDGVFVGTIRDKGGSGAKRSSACDFAGYTIHFGRIMDGAEVLDEVMVSVFRAPHSYAGEDGVEISCHGSPYIVSRLLELLIDRGARLALPGEFTQRAFLAGKMDLAQAEAVADVIGADSAAAHRVAVNHLLGGYSSKLKELRGSLVELSALLELELDFSEEDVEFADRSKLSALCGEAMAECSRLADSFRLGNAVKDGVPVAIVGAPNSGKSTLLNALLCDQRAIVSDIPGTTRDTIEECIIIGDLKFRFIDTAGLRETSDVVEKMGIERSIEAIRKAAIVIEVVDVSGEDARLAEFVSDAADLGSRQIAEALSASQRHIIAYNKCDKAVAACDFDCPADFSQHSSSRLQAVAACDFDCPADSADFAADPDGRASRCPYTASQAKVDSDLCGTASDAINENMPVAVKISAKMGTGLDKLKALLCEMSGVAGASEAVLVTNARHAAELLKSASALQRVLDGLSSGIDGALVADDLREALTHLGSITGEISSDEVLGEIFGRFCIGK